MGNPRRRRRVERQLLLPIDEPSGLPKWETLPHGTRKEAVELLVSMLQAQFAPPPADGRQVADDE